MLYLQADVALLRQQEEAALSIRPSLSLPHKTGTDATSSGSLYLPPPPQQRQVLIQFFSSSLFLNDNYSLHSAT